MSDDSKERVAKGAGQAVLGRLGAGIEALSIIAFTWAYGVTTFGLYAVLWSWMKVLTGVGELAMNTMLQRYVPREDAVAASRTLGVALKASFFLSLSGAVGIALIAPVLAPMVSVADADRAHVLEGIYIYIWVLPLWTFVEVGTAAIRATRRFGPEIKVRVFYEQGARLVFAMGIWVLVRDQDGDVAGALMTNGLLIAHLGSVALAALFTLRLIGGSYNLKQAFAAPLWDPAARERLAYGLAIMPANLAKKLFSELPIMLLNIALSGAAGAAASAVYAVARKVASILQLVRLAFDYVMAPLAAERDGAGDRSNLLAMCRFSTRLAVAFGLPLFGAVAMVLPLLFATLPAAMQAALPVTLVLMGGRALELMAGPAASLIEVMGRNWWPAFNGFLGIAVLLLLSLWLIPGQGTMGAAIAAAAGLIVAALAGLLEARLALDLRFHGGLLWRYLLVSLLLTTPLLVLAFASDLPPVLLAGLALPCFALVAVFMVRYGLVARDAAALGHIGRKIRGE